MDVSGISQTPEPQSSDRVKKVSDKKSASNTPKAPEGDRIDISSQAKAAQTDLDLIKVINELPEIRTDLIEKAKQDLDSGKLFTKEVLEKTADEILKNL